MKAVTVIDGIRAKLWHQGQILLKVDNFGGCKFVEVDAFAVVGLHYATDLAITPTACSEALVMHAQVFGRPATPEPSEKCFCIHLVLVWCISADN